MSPAVLKPLHPERLLSLPKLASFRKLSTSDLVESLRPGQIGSLKVRADGSIMDGHHRVFILREREIDVEVLPREEWPHAES
jgi:ParB-like chromosome segregation protein Spo0J